MISVLVSKLIFLKGSGLQAFPTRDNFYKTDAITAPSAEDFLPFAYVTFRQKPHANSLRTFEFLYQNTTNETTLHYTATDVEKITQSDTNVVTKR